MSLALILSVLWCVRAQRELVALRQQVASSQRQLEATQQKLAAQAAELHAERLRTTAAEEASQV